MKQLKLTDWSTGEAVYVDRDSIMVCRRIEASIHEYGNGPTELGERTRIDIGHDTFLVRETPDEIFNHFERYEVRSGETEYKTNGE